MSILQLFVLGGDSLSIDYIIIGGGQAGGVLVAGRGGQVVQGNIKPSGATTINVTVGGGGSPNGGSGTPSSISYESTSISAGGGDGFGLVTAVTTWAGQHSGQNTYLEGSGGVAGGNPGSCWWATVGYPQLCAPPITPAGYGYTGAVYLREPTSVGVRSFNGGGSYLGVSNGFRIYKFSSSGTFSVS